MIIKERKFYYIGALTSKPYTFKGRNWELRKVFSIDLFDSLGSNILVEVKGKTIMRIKPKSNDSINEDWITDKVRFSYDSLLNNRLINSYYKNKKLKNYDKINLDSSFKIIKFNFLFSNFCTNYGHLKINIAGFIGDNISSEGTLLFKYLLNKLGSVNFNSQNNNKFTDLVINNRLNMQINGIEKSDLIFLIGLDPRLESPILNLRIRKQFLKNGLLIASFGFLYNPLYDFYNLGNSPKNMLQFIEGRHKFSYKFISSKNPNFLISSLLFNRVDGQLIYKLLKNLILSINLTYSNLNIINLFAVDNNLIELGLNNNINNNKFDYNINIYLNTNKVRRKLTKNDFNIYIGSYGDSDFLQSDLLIPISNIYEFDGLYINNEGFCQEAKYITNVSNNLVNEVDLLLSLLKNLGYNELKNQKSVRTLLINNYSSIYKLDDLRKKFKLNFVTSSLYNYKFPLLGYLNKFVFNYNIENFYMTNLMLKNSKVMGECSQKLLNTNNLNFIKNKKKCT